jgi:type II secretory pathway component PulJ
MHKFATPKGYGRFALRGETQRRPGMRSARPRGGSNLREYAGVAGKMVGWRKSKKVLSTRYFPRLNCGGAGIKPRSPTDGGRGVDVASREGDGWLGSEGGAGQHGDI